MHVRVKICGVTTPEAALAAARAGADAIGLVFADSPRRVDIARAREIARTLPASVVLVAVFRDPEPAFVLEVVRAVGPHVVQAEPAPGLGDCLRGSAGLLAVFHDGPDVVDRVRRHRAAGGGASPVLLEAEGRGGRGVAPDWERAAALARAGPLVLAGGLGPDNVAAAIRRVRPWGVDVSSGVESAPGVKDPERVAEFLAAVRRAEEAGEAER